MFERERHVPRPFGADDGHAARLEHARRRDFIAVFVHGNFHAGMPLGIEIDPELRRGAAEGSRRKFHGKPVGRVDDDGPRVDHLDVERGENQPDAGRFPDEFDDQVRDVDEIRDRGAPRHVETAIVKNLGGLTFAAHRQLIPEPSLVGDDVARVRVLPLAFDPGLVERQPEIGRDVFHVSKGLHRNRGRAPDDVRPRERDGRDREREERYGLVPPRAFHPGHGIQKFARERA